MAVRGRSNNATQIRSIAEIRIHRARAENSSRRFHAYGLDFAECDAMAARITAHIHESACGNGRRQGLKSRTDGN